MKISKVIHVVSVMVGIIGVICFLCFLFGKTPNFMMSGVIILIAIWLQVATIHHMMLEKKGEKI